MTANDHKETTYPAGFLDKNLAECRAKTACDGDCESHDRGLYPVRCVGQKFRRDRGYFAYCASAIKEDTERGLTVLMEGQAGFLPNEDPFTPKA